MPTDRASRWSSEQRWVVAAMSIANFAVALDFLGVNVALPAIGRDLDGSTGALQWVSTAYLLTLTTVLVPAGRAADLFGRMRCCVVGLGVFAAASVASALAGSIPVLVVARAATGVGAAILTATTLAIVGDAFPDRRSRGPAIGIWTAIGAVGSALGPPAAGVITEAASWRWFLVLAVPLAAGALVLVRRGRRGTPVDVIDGPRMDWPGAALLALATAAGVAVLLEGPDIGWTSPGVLIGAVVAVGAVVAFSRRERGAAVPLVDRGLLGAPQLLGSAGVAFVANLAFACVLFFMTLYLQQVQGLSPSEAGFVFLALSATLVVAAPIAGRAVRRVGASTVMTVGMLVLVASFVVLGRVGVASSLVVVVVGLALSGIGQGFAFDASNTAALDAVPDADAGAAAGLVAGVRQAGSLVGLAVAGTVFRLLRDSPGSGTGGSGTGPLRSFVDALGPTMLGVAACCALGAVLAIRVGVRARTGPPTG